VPATYVPFRNANILSIAVSWAEVIKAERIYIGAVEEDSTAKKDTISRIVPYLAQGAGVTTTRADVQYFITEYGIADLFGKTVRERVKDMIEIAHPKFREELEKKAREYKYLW